MAADLLIRHSTVRKISDDLARGVLSHDSLSPPALEDPGACWLKRLHTIASFGRVLSILNHSVGTARVEKDVPPPEAT